MGGQKKETFSLYFHHDTPAVEDITQRGFAVSIAWDFQDQTG